MLSLILGSFSTHPGVTPSLGLLIFDEFYFIFFIRHLFNVGKLEKYFRFFFFFKPLLVFDFSVRRGFVIVWNFYIFFSTISFKCLLIKFSYPPPSHLIFFYSVFKCPVDRDGATKETSHKQRYINPLGKLEQQNLPTFILRF